MCVALGEEDNMEQSLTDTKEIARKIMDINETAYTTYKPIVDDICTRIAPEYDVEHLLDYMVGICNDERMLQLFKQVCRSYIDIYPRVITAEIYTYKEMYEES
ncbi:MAG: hypothetical protein IIT46_18355 [Lachnospiraceae bacterium]|nr:hypothetical protein [Lachnospiraceae bacterium]